MQDPNRLGALPRPKDDRDFLLGAIQAPVTIPASYVPDITWIKRNYQAQTTFCGEHAATHFKAILDHAADATDIEHYTPRYGSIKLKTPGSPVCDGYAPDAGTDMRSIFNWLKTVGADDFEPLENDVTLPITTYLSPTVITSDMDAAAATKKIASYAFGDTDFATLSQHIYQNKAVLLLIRCDGGFWGTTTPTFTTPKYGHFVCAYGYDATFIYVIDSADPNDVFAFKKINKKYITPTFIIESGTAIDIPPEKVRAIIQTTQNVVTEVVAAPISNKDKSALLSQIVVLLKSIASLFQLKVGASPQPIKTMNYSLFKSRTFWTIVVQFLSNGFLAISGNFNPTVVLLVNAALGSLATYFHDAGVTNAAVASAQATAATTTGAIATPKSGQ